MALQGSIRDFGLPDIFQLIGLQRKTGVLTLKRADESITVTFENGMVVNADTTQKRNEDRIGSLLVKQGRLSEEQLEEVLQKQKATLQRLGHVLVSSGYITPEDLKRAIQIQVNQNVYKLFRWKEGDYHFEPTEKVEFDRTNINPMSSDFILMEGIRMLDEWPIIEKKIPTMDIVFRPAVDASNVDLVEGDGGDDSGAFGDKKGAASSRIHLQGDEARVFRKVDGVRTVQGVIDASGLADFDACKALFDLLSRNIVAPSGRGAAGPAGGARVDQASPALGYVMLAAAILLTLGSLGLHRATPFGVLGQPALLGPAYESALSGVSRGRLERLDAALQAYRLSHASQPPTLDSLVQERLIDARFLKDPWNRDYRYEPSSLGYRLAALTDAGQPDPAQTIERAFPPPPAP
jgi:hypothetical protein